jgi:hypothetical protein
MASIQKTKNGYRVQIAIRGIRENSSFHTKREAESWAARRETEIRDSQNLPPGSKHTLLDAFKRYADEVSPTKRGERWEILRLRAFESHALPLKKTVGAIEPDDMAKWRDNEAAPGGDVLKAFADVGGDVQYVLTGEKSSSALTEDEKELLSGYRDLDVRGKANMLGMLDVVGTTPKPTASVKYAGKVKQVVEGDQTVNGPLTFGAGEKKKKKTLPE